MDITAATSLLKHAASSGFQHLVKGEIINILMLLGISSRGADAVGVVELCKSLIKHALSDAVQELAAMEAAPTAGDMLERVIKQQKLGDMGGLVEEGRDEDFQKHAKRVSRPHKTRSQAQAAPVDHPESTVEDPHSAGIALSLEHVITPAPRATPPSAAASSGAAPKRLHQIKPRKNSAVEASCPWPSAARYPAIRTKHALGIWTASLRGSA